VFDMLLAVPKVGSVKATKILHSCRVSPSKTFGGLSERQRAELADRPSYACVADPIAFALIASNSAWVMTALSSSFSGRPRRVRGPSTLPTSWQANPADLACGSVRMLVGAVGRSLA
jgi:hypothetical protein